MTTTVISIVALVVSIVSLWIAGRRDQRKFLRDTNLQVLIEFLDASFRGVLQESFQAGYGERRTPPLHESFVAQWEATRTEKLRALTKLHLTAPESVVKAAEALHLAEEQFHQDLLSVYAVDMSTADYKTRKSEQNALRKSLINRARKALRVPKSAAFEYTEGRVGIVQKASTGSARTE